MKKPIILIFLVFIGIISQAQVQKTIVVEHFTNSVCGVCAIKNPGLYQNLADHPEILHIAFHPSSPYASCLFSQQNPVENDDRTKWYSIYGGTPWLVIQGEVQSSGTNFGNPSLFNPFYGETTPFSLTVKEYRYETDNVQVEVTIKAVTPHSQEQALLFLGFVEDTVFYTSPNGESTHTDIFRKSLTDIEGDMISLPSAGDSVVMSFSLSPNALWNIDRMYSMAILQDPASKMVMQAGKTSIIEYMDPSFIGTYERPSEKLNIYPNPAAGSKLTISNADDKVLISGMDGRIIKAFDQQGGRETIIDIADLSEGIYIIRSGNKIARLAVAK